MWIIQKRKKGPGAVLLQGTIWEERTSSEQQSQHSEPGTQQELTGLHKHDVGGIADMEQVPAGGELKICNP